jgi:hypothetical protein
MADQGVPQAITGRKSCPLTTSDIEVFGGHVEWWERQPDRAASDQRDALVQQLAPSPSCIWIAAP